MGNVKMVWGNEDNGEVHYGTGELSLANGITGFQSYTISDTGNFFITWGGGCIDIAASGNNVYAIWFDHDWPYGSFQVRFSKSADGGITWSEPVAIWDSEVIEAYCISSLRLRRDSNGRLYVAFAAIGAGGGWPTGCWGVSGWIAFMISEDDGDSWSLSYPMQEDCPVEEWLDMELDSNDNIYISYQDTTVSSLYSIIKSIDHGVSWGEPVQLPGIDYAYGPQDLEVGDSDEVHFIAPADIDGGVGWKYLHWVSWDGGATWNGPTVCSSEGVPDDWDDATPRFKVSGPDIHAFWYTSNPEDEDDYQLYYSHSGDSGTTWDNLGTFVAGGNTFEPEYGQGPQCVLYLDNIIFYQFFGLAAPRLKAGSFTSDTGEVDSWIENELFAYPPGHTYLQGSIIGIPTLAQARTYYFLA